MSTSERAYVWAWLPGRQEPVVCGVLERAGGGPVRFAYGRSYRERPEALALYDIPLVPGWQEPPSGMNVHGCFADAAPDAWGRRVVLHRLSGRAGKGVETDDLSLFTYLLESASDRTGALDFQTSPDEYVKRGVDASLQDMMRAAELLQTGAGIPPVLEIALFHGTTIGGARPKATLEDKGRHLIAKFASSTDPYPAVKAEAAAMTLANFAGLDVPAVWLVECLGKEVLLVERFDRTQNGGRKMVVSALTVLRLPEELGRYASYVDFADKLRASGRNTGADLRELFARISFNIIVSNNDDHAKNHAVFFDGGGIALTPAYDVCPQLRSGGEQQQAMAIGRDGWRFSQLAGCIRSAHNYLLDEDEARAIVMAQIETVHDRWEDAADAGRLTRAERDAMWGQQILHPYSLEGLRAFEVGFEAGHRPAPARASKCRFCHRPLRGARSIELGCGPRCAERHGLAH